MTTVFVLLLSTLFVMGQASAAERNHPIRIGALTESWGPTPAMVGLRDGLKELGYRENRDFVIGVRFTQGDMDALSVAAHELMQQGVHLVFTAGRHAAKAAQMATKQLPIVFAGGGDPVRLGLIQSFARPGGNITGITNLDLELGPRRLEIFTEVIAGLQRVLFPYDPADTYSLAEANSYRETARRLGIALVEKPVRGQEKAQATLARVRKRDVNGILSTRSLFWNIPGFILEVAARQAIPTMFPEPWYVERGGLVSYSPNRRESGRQAASGHPVTH